MPVEIKELVIRAVVAPPEADSVLEESAEPETVAQQEALVAACVREVLRLLDRAKER